MGNNALGPYARKVRGDSRSHLHTDTRECTDWLAEKLSSYTRGEIAELAGCSKRAAENVKAGENSFSMEKLVKLCRNDPVFRAEFFHYCGGHLENDPEFVAGITMALNSLARRSGGAG